MADRRFCLWCTAFVIDPSAGTKASVMRRFLAAFLDPLLVIAAWGIAGIIGGAIAGSVGWLLVIAVILYQFLLFAQGRTFGKMLFGERVVVARTGSAPGFLRMLVRETLGKFVSGLFFGLGFFWAIWDADHQAWHDKLTGTLVVKAPGKAAGRLVSAPGT